MNPTRSSEIPIQSSHVTDVARWNGQMSDGIGSTYGEPMAFLSATADELLLGGSRGNFRFPRAAVQRVTHAGFYPWLFRGVRIHHGVRAYPVELQFRPADARPREVLEQLKRLGYPVG